MAGISVKVRNLTRAITRFGMGVALLTGICATAIAGQKINTGYFGNVAIQGYDPVAYFTAGEPTKGSEEFSYEWSGATYLFSSAENRDLWLVHDRRAELVSENADIRDRERATLEVVGDDLVFLRERRVLTTSSNIRALSDMADSPA